MLLSRHALIGREPLVGGEIAKSSGAFFFIWTINDTVRAEIGYGEKYREDCGEEAGRRESV